VVLPAPLLLFQRWVSVPWFRYLHMYGLWVELWWCLVSPVVVVCSVDRVDVPIRPANEYSLEG
jgi:hypothetical protein